MKQEIIENGNKRENGGDESHGQQWKDSRILHAVTGDV